MGNRENIGKAAADAEIMHCAFADGANYVLLLNTDITLVTESLISELLALFAMQNCGIVAPVMLFEDGIRVWYAGGRIHRPAWTSSHPGMGRKWRPNSGRLLKRLPEWKKVQAACSCCAMISRRTWQQVGVPDRRLFMYWDDFEYSFRAKQAGITTYLLRRPLLLHHKRNRRLGRLESYYFPRNGLYLIWKHEHWLPARILGVLGQAVLVLPFRLVQTGGDWGAIAAYGRGFVDGLATVAGRDRMGAGRGLSDPADSGGYVTIDPERGTIANR